MRNYLFVGTETDIDIDRILQEASLRMAELGVDVGPHELTTSRSTRDGGETQIHGYLPKNVSVDILFKNVDTNISISQYETEIIPGYSIILEQFTICVSVWTGAETSYEALTACIAAAIAASTGKKILDSEHKWSPDDLNGVDDFMEHVKIRFPQPTKE